MIEISKESTEIFKAILGIQNEFLVIRKATQGKQNQFAAYPELITKCKPVLTKAGVVLIQPVTYDLSPNGDYQPTITTILMHAESGQYIKSTSLVFAMTERKNSKGDPTVSEEQRIGGGISYMKRYALGSILSWATGEYDLDQGVLDTIEENEIALLNKLESEISLLKTVPETEQFYKNNNQKYQTLAKDFIKLLAAKKSAIVEELSNDNP